MISHTHYLHYCTQIVEILNVALSHSFTWIPTTLEIPNRRTNVSHLRSKNPIVQVQKYFDADLSTGALNCTPAKLPGVVGPCRVC
jgi:hypothetical protein